MDDRSLLLALDAFASPARLQLLRQLRTPKVLSEIELAVAVAIEGGGSEERERNISRQSVRKHLDRLLELGIVQERPTRRARGETVEYVVSHQAIFAVSEEFRDLAHLRPVEAPELPTHAARTLGPHAAPGVERPCVVLVKGLDEGRVFPLAAERAAWTIGRHRGADVSLDFDPYVSRENALIERGSDGSFRVSDLGSSTNGTLVNFQRLAVGSTRSLASGDIIGVGRSLLVLWT